MSQLHTFRKAATLIEVLVVISVLGVLFSLLANAVQSVRASADRIKCTNNMKQMALAIHSYESRHRYFPPQPTTSYQSPEALLSWHALILPDIEQNALWEQAAQACENTHDISSITSHVGYSTPIPLYVCPSDPRLLTPLRTPKGDYTAFSSYVGVAGSITLTIKPGVLRGDGKTTFASITDGASQTLMIGERPPPDSLQAGRWYTRRIILEPFGGHDSTMHIPDLMINLNDQECKQARMMFGPGRLNNPCDRLHYWSLHGGGAHFAFADGHVDFIRYTASELMPALATRAGGEIINLD